MKTVDFASQAVLGKTDRPWSISAQRKDLTGKNYNIGKAQNLNPISDSFLTVIYPGSNDLLKGEAEGCGIYGSS
jgi:hypothetical protein